MSHILLNYAFLLFLNFLGEIHREHFFIDIKVTISETSTETRANYEENLDLFKQLFLNKTSKVDKYYQKLFFLKVSQILLNYAFLLLWRILRVIHRELFFLVNKVTISETSTEILRNLFFLPCLKRANSEENLDLFKQVFFKKKLKGDKY